MKPDIVYVVGPDRHNEELRYSLRSLRHIPHGTVWIAGYKPKWVVNVEYLPLRQDKTKYQNSTANLLAACTHPDVADRFVYMNDDFFILRPMKTVPYLHLGSVKDRVDYYDRKYGHRRRGVGRYRDGMVQTSKLLESWGHRTILSYEAHTPMLLEKHKMTEAVNRATRAARIVALHKRTLYGNLYQVGGREIRDVKVLTSAHSWGPGQTFVSSSAQSWSGKLGRRLREMFRDPSPYEEV